MCILLFFEKYRRESRKKIRRDSGVVKFVHVTDKVPLIRNNESWQRSWGDNVNSERTNWELLVNLRRHPLCARQRWAKTHKKGEDGQIYVFSYNMKRKKKEEGEGDRISRVYPERGSHFPCGTRFINLFRSIERNETSRGNFIILHEIVPSHQFNRLDCQRFTTAQKHIPHLLLCLARTNTTDSSSDDCNAANPDETTQSLPTRLS